MKTKSLIQFFLIFCLSFLSFSCMSYSYVSEKKMKDIKLNMNKQEVTSILGNDYQVVSLEEDPTQGEKATLGYEVASYEIYMLHFEKDKLIKIEKVWVCKEEHKTSTKSSTN